MVFDGAVVRAAVTEAEAEIATLRNDLAAQRVRTAAAEDGIAALNARIAELEALAPAARPRALKPGLCGLITTNPDYVAGNIPYATFASTKPRWKDYNPSPEVYVWSGVDNMLAKHPDLRFRLRFMAGIHAPDWAKARSGGAIQHEPNQSNGAAGMVPRFWTRSYFDDYMAFMAAVADRYESNPQVVEIPNALTTTAYAEPFILAADAATIDRYWAAGYRRDLVEQNLLRSVHAMMDLFPTTRVSLACHNKWEFIVQGSGGPGDGQAASSWPDERTILNDLIDTYGPHLVLEDHGLGPTDPWFPVGEPRETADPLYAYMSGLRATPQTYGWQFTLNNGSMPVAADHGVAMGACFLEYAAFTALEPTLRRATHDALLANAAGKP